MKYFLAIFCSLFVVFAVEANDTDRNFTFNLDQAGQRQLLPFWMTGQPTASPSAHASISFPITPLPDNSDLAVTFYFTEVTGGFLRVYWAGSQKSETLSDNLYEGIGMPNQRTLLIKRSTFSSPGSLTVQSSEVTLNVSKIHWAWVDSIPVSLAEDARHSALIDPVGHVMTDDDVDGTPLLAPADQIRQSTVNASLTFKPERIEAGVEFVASLPVLPKYARVEVQINGAPVDKPIQLTLNGTLLGDVSVEIPDLNDQGYQATDGAAPNYIGWRKGTILLPVTQLKIGDNQFQFSVKDVVPASNASPVAIKNLVLQLKYPDQQPAPAPAAADSGTASIVNQDPALSGTSQ